MDGAFGLGACPALLLVMIFGGAGIGDSFHGRDQMDLGLWLFFTQHPWVVALNLLKRGMFAVARKVGFCLPKTSKIKVRRILQLCVTCVPAGFGGLMAPGGFGSRLRSEFEGYSSSSSRCGNVQPAHREAFDFNSHIPEQN